LPWRRPWKVASQAATLDQLSNGRTILAVGLGSLLGDLPRTGEVLDLRERADMLDEGIALVRTLLSGGQGASRPPLRVHVRAGRAGGRRPPGAGADPHLGRRRLAAAEVDAARARMRRDRAAVRRR